MQHQGNFGRDFQKLDPRQLQQVQESIQIYRAQGLGNHPQCKTLENVLQENLSVPQSGFVQSAPREVPLVAGATHHRFGLPQSPHLSISGPAKYSGQSNSGREMTVREAEVQTAALATQSAMEVMNPMQGMRFQQSYGQSNGFLGNSMNDNQQQVIDIFKNNMQTQQQQQQQLQRQQQQPQQQQQAQNVPRSRSGNQKAQARVFSQPSSFQINPQPGHVFPSTQDSNRKMASGQLGILSGLGGGSSQGLQPMLYSRQNQASSSPSNIQGQVAGSSGNSHSQFQAIGSSLLPSGNGSGTTLFPLRPGHAVNSLQSGPSRNPYKGAGVQNVAYSQVTQGGPQKPSGNIWGSGSQIPSSSAAKNAVLKQANHSSPGVPSFAISAQTSEQQDTSQQVNRSGGSREENLSGYGFTTQQLSCLKSQINAIKRLERGDKTLPADLITAIAPPPLPELVQISSVQQSLQRNIMGGLQPSFNINSGVSQNAGAVSSALSHAHLGTMQGAAERSSFAHASVSNLTSSSNPQLKAMKAEMTSEDERQRAKAEEKRKRRQEQRKAKAMAGKLETTHVQETQQFEETVGGGTRPMVQQEEGSNEGSASDFLGKMADMGGALAPYMLPGSLSRDSEEPGGKLGKRSLKGPIYEPVPETLRTEQMEKLASVKEVGFDVKLLMAVELKKVLEKEKKRKLEELDCFLDGKMEGAPAENFSAAEAKEKGTNFEQSGAPLLPPAQALKPEERVRLRVQQKMLKLSDLQQKVRQSVERDQVEIAEMGDRAYRTFLRQCEKQRSDMAKQTMQAQRASREKFLKTMTQCRKKFLELQWSVRDARAARNKGVLKLHEKLLREHAKKKDEDRSKRMEALKNNDVDAYREMLQKQQTDMMPGDSRAGRFEVLSTFLSKTEEYLKKLGGKISAVKNQQELDDAAQAAMADARAQGFSEEEVREAGEDAIEGVRKGMWEVGPAATSGAASVSKYYALAHSVTERIVKQPSMLASGTLREYQMVGLQWMLSLYNNRLNGILADEMGLGKTVQVMALIAYLMESKGNYGPHLIIVPNAVMVNWKSELLRWLPSVNCVYYVGTREQRTRIFNQEMAAQTFNVLVTTYEFIMRDRSKLSKVDWKYIIIDEAQRMKDRESRLSRDLDRYRCQRRLLLTGTPLQNDLQELWSLLNLLLPDVFDSSKMFLDWFDKPFQGNKDAGGEEEDEWLETEKKVIVIHRLHQILEPFMLRRRVEDVEGSLPPKVSVVLKCRMSSYQSAIYDWVKATGTLRVDPEVEAGRIANSDRQARAFAPLQNKCMELKKVCNHPFLSYSPQGFLPPEAMVRTCGKLQLLDRILLKLRRTGHKVLLFSTMTRLLDILEDYLVWRGLPFRRIDGMTPLDARESAIVDFNGPNSTCFIFLLSIRAAGRGLNLQSADTVVIYDPDPNPKNEEQAVARAHRIGQKREVKVIYFEAVVESKPFFKREDEERVRKLKREWEKVDRKLRRLEAKGRMQSEKGQALQGRLEKVTRRLSVEEGNGEEEEERAQDFDGSDPFVGSIETLIRHNIQQHKIEMADEVINAGRFDQLTTQEERRMTLEAMLHDEDRYQQRVHSVPSMEEINRLIARSEEEVELFDQMDAELEWPELMEKRSEVPPWLRTSCREVKRVQALTAKPSLRMKGKRGFQEAAAEDTEMLGRGARGRKRLKQEQEQEQEQETVGAEASVAAEEARGQEEVPSEGDNRSSDREGRQRGRELIW